jgi:pyruvate dehydrogenase E2 component (dihydrolipoamide acetyltransferase)
MIEINMALEVKLPSLGDGITSGDVLEIFVSEGDVVSKDQGLMEMETDKATVSVPSPAAGKVAKILVSKGQSVPIGSALIVLEPSGVAAAPAAAPKPAPPPKAAPTPVAAAPVAAPPPAAVTPPPPPKPAPVAAPAPVAHTPPPVVAAPAPTTAAPVAAAPVSDGGVIPAGPAVRRFAREVGVDLSQVAGSGEGGRITREDVLAVVRRTSQSARSAAPGTAAPASGATATPTDNGLNDDYGPIRVEKMSKIRKTIANQMHRSWSNVPRVTNFDDADVTELEAFRQSSKDDYAARGIKLTTMPFLIKAVATALRHHPAINATIDMENEQIVFKEYINIGIAIDTDRGLVVPTLKAADRMSIPDIAKALGDMSVRVRNGDFGVNDLRGGSFTISNLGAIGGTYSTPIVNVPEVAILLVGRARKLPCVMDDDTIVPRLMMPLSLSYDHRLVDGGTAARFLNDIIGYLEAPSRLLLAI